MSDMVEKVARAIRTYGVRIWSAPHLYAVIASDAWDTPVMTGLCAETAYNEAAKLNAAAALTAISEAGYAVVPQEATADILAKALPVVESDPSDTDKRLGAEACFILEGPRKIKGDRSGAIISAAQLAQDYRSMIQAGDVAKETVR